MAYPHQTFTADNPLLIGSPTNNPPFEVELTSTWTHIPVGVSLWVTGTGATALVEDHGHLPTGFSAPAAETPEEGQGSGPPEQEPTPEAASEEVPPPEPQPEPTLTIPRDVPQPSRAGPGSSRRAWLEYADIIGMKGMAEASRDEIVAAVDALAEEG